MNRGREIRLLSGLFDLDVAPVLAVLLYPKANWLFALVVIDVAVLILNVRFAKDPHAPGPS